jgi:hypothetical protein
MNIALGATGLNRPTPKGQEGPIDNEARARQTLGLRRL